MKLNKTYNENCLDTMARMDDNFIDLTVTSPPYDNLRTYKNDIDKTWGQEIWEKIIKEFFRVTKVGGVVVWIVNDATIKGSETGTSFKQVLFFKACGFNLHDTMIFEKLNSIPLNHNRYDPNFEYMFILSKNKLKTFNPIKIPCKTAGSTRNRGTEKKAVIDKNSSTRQRKEKTKVKREKYKKNVWSYPIATDKTAHPAPFPEKLASDHIISWSNENDLIFDPFMGSGTVAKMALLNNRNYIGSEISKKYCEIIKERLKK